MKMYIIQGPEMFQAQELLSSCCSHGVRVHHPLVSEYVHQLGSSLNSTVSGSSWGFYYVGIID